MIDELIQKGEIIEQVAGQRGQEIMFPIIISINII
jgi:hypothetical protein